MLEDSLLLERCRSGDELAWESFVRRYQGRVHSVAWHYLHDAEEARDLAQEIFVRVWQKLETFQGDENVLPWLMRLTRNAAIDRLRRRAARPPARDLPADEAFDLASNEAPPDEAALQAQSRCRLYRALDLLTKGHREMILLKEIQGLKLDEISGLLGLPLGTVKSRSRRARVELATKLQSLDEAVNG